MTTGYGGYEIDHESERTADNEGITAGSNNTENKKEGA